MTLSEIEKIGAGESWRGATVYLDPSCILDFHLMSSDILIFGSGAQRRGSLMHIFTIWGVILFGGKYR